MHETPPGFLAQLMKWFSVHHSMFFAAGAAFSISALMSLYDGKSLLKTATGSLACGILTLAVAGSLEFFDFPPDSVIFIGASIGFMGAEKVRDKVTNLIESRTRSGKDEQ
ncbi:phage holin family protein [Serratia microhaemolytica]|uniref:phage holin family protein n=1 Tax=Serratia microhaemolytica TaxID=2675110 RepID=UPI000FDE1E5F|nr:phage holin family protein [Serratia microhaemolytica]